MQTAIITNLNTLLGSRFFDSFQGGKLGNDLFLSDPDRASRNYDAAENGCDGSTHAEHIEDMREANDLAEREVYRAQFIAQGYDADCASMLAEALKEYIAADIDDCEAWHEKNGSLDQVIG